jgi:enoyl-CoA hydratase/carnithine racemase
MPIPVCQQITSVNPSFNLYLYYDRASMNETLLLERDRPVGWLVFNRPAVGNAMHASMMAGLPEAWARLEGDAAVRVIAVTGRGQAFQTGLDLKRALWQALETGLSEASGGDHERGAGGDHERGGRR